MRKLLCCVCLFFLAFTAVAAEEGDFHLYFEPFVRYAYGHKGEYLYEKNKSGDYKKLSYLEWEEQPLWLYGMNVGGAYKRLSVQLSITTARSDDCGMMYDSDWKLLDSTKTNYSESDNSLDSYFVIGGKIGFRFEPCDWLHITPNFELGYDNMQFQARDGQGWYGDTVAASSPSATYYGVGQLCGIDYQRQTFYTFLGVGLSFVPLKRVALSFEGAVSPYSYARADDTHYTNLERTSKNCFLDITHLFFRRFKAGSSVYVTCNDVFTFGFSASYLVELETLGDTYQSIGGKKAFSRVSSAKGGVSEQQFSFGISCRIHIF